MDLRAYVEPIWARRWLVLLIVVIATGATYAYFTKQPKEYTASTDVFVQTSELDRALFGAEVGSDPDRNTANQASFLRSRSVAEGVAKRIGFKGSPGELSKKIEVVSAEGNDFVTIRATDSTPARTAKLANAFATALIALREASTRDRVQASIQVAQRELDQLNETRSDAGARRSLRSQIRRLQVIESLPAGRVDQVDKAVPPAQPSAPKPKRNAAFAFLLSLVFACGAALGLGRLDRRIGRPEDVEEVFGLPMLGVIPHGTQVAEDENSGPAVPEDLQEAFRTLRTNLNMHNLDRPLRTILVTSASPGEGKSSVVRNLALAYREAGLRVAVLEADLRQPTLPKLLGVERDPGFTNVLSEGAAVHETLQTVSGAKPQAIMATTPQAGSGAQHNGAGIGHLSVMTSGPPIANPPAVLAAERSQAILTGLADEHDVVLIDSPPILAVSDAMPLLSVVDGTLFVARLGLTREDSARRLVELVRRVPNVNLLGVVANDVPEGLAPYSSYGY